MHHPLALMVGDPWDERTRLRSAQRLPPLLRPLPLLARTRFYAVTSGPSKGIHSSFQPGRMSGHPYNKFTSRQQQSLSSPQWRYLQSLLWTSLLISSLQRGGNSPTAHTSLPPRTSLRVPAGPTRSRRATANCLYSGEICSSLAD